MALSVLQPKVEEELPGNKVLESEQEKMSHGFQPERDPSELKKAKPVEENGEQEAEPVRNGAEIVSEGEGTDANSGFTESSSEGPVYQYKPGKSCSRLRRARLGLCLPPPRTANTPHVLTTGFWCLSHQHQAQRDRLEGHKVVPLSLVVTRRKSQIPWICRTCGCWLRRSRKGSKSVPL